MTEADARSILSPKVASASIVYVAGKRQHTATMLQGTFADIADLGHDCQQIKSVIRLVEVMSCSQVHDTLHHTGRDDVAHCGVQGVKVARYHAAGSRKRPASANVTNIFSMPSPLYSLTSTMPRSNSPAEGQQPPVPRVTSPSRDRESRHDRKRHHHAHRSRSPRRDGDEHRHKRHRSRSPKAKPVILPYKAKPLSKRHYDDYKPLFQSYLDIQKNIQLDDLDEREAKGRWKSFTSRWYVP
jgi:hypothetical protein